MINDDDDDLKEGLKKSMSEPSKKKSEIHFKEDGWLGGSFNENRERHYHKELMRRHPELGGTSEENFNRKGFTMHTGEEDE